MKEKWDAFMGRAGFWVTMAVCLLVAGISGYFLLRDTDSNADVPVEPTAVIQEAAAPAEVTQTPEQEDTPPVIVETLLPEPLAEEPPSMPELQVDDTPVIAQAPQLIVSPLNGEVLTAFSMDTLVYSSTLGDWRTHDGIDIFAKPGTTVQAASAGTVDAVTDDALMGTTITISHADGYQTIYANLQAKPAVSAGDRVTVGQIIGAVGTTAAVESGENPHLHFSVFKNGEPVDPHEFLAK